MEPRSPADRSPSSADEPLPRGIVLHIADRWKVDRDSLRLLGRQRNLVYAVDRAEQPLILRLSLQSGRGRADFEAELHWLAYLAHAGVRVSLPVPSQLGNCVESLELNQQHTVYAVAFARLPGLPPALGTSHEWDSDLVEQLGSTLGRIHASNRGYRPLPDARRFAFADRDLPALAAKLLPEEGDLLLRLQDFWSALQALPRESCGYGLVHGDFHPPNLLVADGEVAVIDFDSCCYSWFALDLAQCIALTVLPLGVAGGAAAERDGRAFCRRFLLGYLRENELGREWFERLPELLAGFGILYTFSLMAKQVALPRPVDFPTLGFARRCALAGRPYPGLDFAALHDEVHAELQRRLKPSWPRRLFGWLFRGRQS